MNHEWNQIRNSERIGLVFTGQGSQTEHMGRSLYETYEEAKEVYALLPERLRTMSFTGSLEEISKTEHLQPIMLALQLSIDRILKNRGIRPFAVCGLSLGEYAALVSCGAMSPEDALRVIEVRGNEMALAAEKIESGMAAVIGMPEEEIESIVSGIHEEDTELTEGRAYLSNINSPRQIVISGEKTAVDRSAARLKEKKAKVLPLNVSGPFHTPYMQPAVPGLKAALALTDWKYPEVDCYTNTTGESVRKEFSEADFREAIISNLTKQMTCPVRLYDCLKHMVESGIEEIIEIGPGKVIASILKKEFPHIRIVNIEKAEDLEW